MATEHLLVTGGAGFIGGNFARLALNKGYAVTVLDKLSYAGCLKSLDDLQSRERFHFIHGAIEDKPLVEHLIAENSFSGIVNFAAESHVDRSIEDPESFIISNVLAVQRLLSAIQANKARLLAGFRYLQVSTDEVYGSAEDGDFEENTPYNPNSPYAASKAAADHLVRAAFRTFDLPTLITNCSNNYGPYQFPEKLIPLMIIKALHGEGLPLYGDGLQMRDWLFVDDHCEAVLEVLKVGTIGETYVIGGRSCVPNIDIVYGICDRLDRKRPRPDGKSYRSLIQHVADRPGHDRKYSVNPSKIERELGWCAEWSLEQGLDKTVDWYLENQEWWASLLKENYDGSRLGLIKNNP